MEPQWLGHQHHRSSEALDRPKMPIRARSPAWVSGCELYALQDPWLVEPESLIGWWNCEKGRQNAHITTRKSDSARALGPLARDEMHARSYNEHRSQETIYWPRKQHILLYEGGNRRR
ncbi:hypothetical protein CSOJ01_07283 [Colletotrichum sojae]|uniref:Uncharacterized protein n=1 Tax=Colletotrichum sojae TaxID=2175907 RepID=A0A8H6JA63_9PEZI|nr:hypothetical protein CSOJ01_07283 [Colletotrichum sojae]